MMGLHQFILVKSKNVLCFIFRTIWIYGGGREELSCDCGCNSKDLVEISEKDRFGLHVSTKVCPKCGLLLTNPRMNQTTYNWFYDIYFAPIYRGTSHVTQEYYDKQCRHGEEIYEYLSDNIIMDDIDSILEVGCGAGGILSAFYSASKERRIIKGIDLGAEYIEFGREKGLNLECMHSSQLLKSNSKFDLIILSHVLEHFCDIEQELKIIRELLSDKGYLYIEVPGICSIPDVYQGNILRYLQNAHTRHFHKNTLMQLMRWNGFSCVKSDEWIHSLYIKSMPDKSVENFYDQTMKVLSHIEEVFDCRIQEIQKPQKDNEILSILRLWMKDSLNGNRIDDYLHRHSISKIGIYGFGILGQFLYKEIKEVCQCFIIDRNEVLDINIPLYKPFDVFPKCDIVILTTVDEYTSIRREIQKRNDVRVEPLWWILNKMNVV